MERKTCFLLPPGAFGTPPTDPKNPFDPTDLSCLQLLPSGYPCREAQNECDLTEVCTGFSGKCPPDIYVKNTVPCNNGNGYCFNGKRIILAST